MKKQFSLVVYLLAFLLLACESNQTSLTPSLELDEAELRKVMATMPEYAHLKQLQEQRFSELTNRLSTLTSSQKAVLDDLRDKYPNTESIVKAAPSLPVDAKQYLEIIGENRQVISSINEQVQLIESKLSGRYSFSKRTFFAALQLTDANARQKPDCAAAASNVYHATYYTARWETGMNEASATFYAQLAADSYYQGCMDAQSN
jgi:hypothetical protein